MKKEKSSIIGVLLVIGIVTGLILITYISYSLWIAPNEPVKEMQDYTWQQVAYIGVILFGTALIIAALNPKISFNYYNSKGGVTK